MAQNPEDKNRLHREWKELAIQQATEGKWEEAVTTNENILGMFPEDIEAHNRQGKALSELGQYAKAREAYGKSLALNSENTIARSNLERLSLLGEHAKKPKVHGSTVDPRMFIDEFGKTTTTSLINIATPKVLAKVTVGDVLQMDIQDYSIFVENYAKENIGQIEPRLANRLLMLMKGGNTYTLVVLEVQKNGVRIFVREKYQHPTMSSTVSFPPDKNAAISLVTDDEFLDAEGEELSPDIDRDELTDEVIVEPNDDDEDDEDDEAEGEKAGGENPEVSLEVLRKNERKGKRKTSKKSNADEDDEVEEDEDDEEETDEE